MKKIKRWGIFILIILGLAFITNPSFDSHKEKLEKEYIEKNPLTGYFGASKLLVNLVEYHDKTFYSYTTEKIKNNKVSFGVFGSVWVVNLDIDQFEEFNVK